jgi:hypothetical protein
MKKKISQVVLLVGIIILILLLPKNCSSSKIKTDTVITVKTDTAWNIRTVKSRIYIPGETQFLPGTTTYLPIDTAALLADYLGTRIYHDTVIIDSFGFVAVHDSISKNKIKSRQNEKNYKIPVITKEVTKEIQITKLNKKVFGGILLDPVTFGGFGMITYKNESDKLYHIGAGASIKGGFSVMGGVSVPLWQSK